MRDLDYLTLLSHEYPSAEKTAAEIINLRALCGMPKGTEYFFSDLHGEHQAFIHMLRSCSGIIKAKIKETFGNDLSEEEQLALAELIYYPERHLKHSAGEPHLSRDWQEKTILQLIQVTRVCSKKFTRRKIRQTNFAYSSPVAHRYSLYVILGIAYLLLVVWTLPVPVPPQSIPIGLFVVACALNVLLTNTQKRI